MQTKSADARKAFGIIETGRKACQRAREARMSMKVSLRKMALVKSTISDANYYEVIVNFDGALQCMTMTVLSSMSGDEDSQNRTALVVAKELARQFYLDKSEPEILAPD
jgi:hypothetical protein